MATGSKSVPSNGADAGVDVRGTQGSRRLILQAKHFKSGGNVGRPDLQKLMGVAQTNHATDVILASSSGFTRQAIAEEKQAYNLGYKFQLWDGKKLDGQLANKGSYTLKVFAWDESNQRWTAYLIDDNEIQYVWNASTLAWDVL